MSALHTCDVEDTMADKAPCNNSSSEIFIKS